MGAITDHRKRSFADLFPPPSLPPSKFPRPTPLPTSCFAAAFSKLVLSPPPQSAIPSPLSPLRRSIHAPQRIIRPFGLGSSPYRILKHLNTVEMGNLCSQRRQRKADDRVTLKVGGRSAVTGNATGMAIYDTFSQEMSGLSILTQKENKGHFTSALAMKVGDGRMISVAETTPVRYARVPTKEPPLYKKLYEDTKKCDARLNGLDIELELTRKKISGFQIVTELVRMKERIPKDDSKGLFFHPLSFHENEEVSHALYGGISHEILVTHEPSNIVISRKVLQCLRPGAWLNDEVINLYLELLKEREKREHKNFLKCHFFNTFFFKKLTNGKNGYDFRAVRRWTTQKKLGYTLIECDKVFVPIHKGTHWCLAVINIKDETFQYLDSLGGMDTRVMNVLARYLTEETRDKSDTEIDGTSWKKEPVDGLPLQKNGWDCGMFMIKYTDLYSRGSKLYFSQEHMDYFRRKTAKEILRLRVD